MTKETLLLCSACIHSTVPLSAKIASFPFKPNAFFFRCKKDVKEEHIDFNPVTGPKKIQKHYESCHVTRSSYSGICGPEGKLWSPKQKKNIFLAITRGNV